MRETNEQFMREFGMSMDEFLDKIYNVPEYIGEIVEDVPIDPDLIDEDFPF